MGVNIEDKELVKMFNPTLKMRETILFFLIVVINGLNCLRYWARYVCKEEVMGGGIKNGNESASWILLLDSPFRVSTIQFLIVLFPLLLYFAPTQITRSSISVLISLGLYLSPVPS